MASARPDGHVVLAALTARGPPATVEVTAIDVEARGPRVHARVRAVVDRCARRRLCSSTAVLVDGCAHGHHRSQGMTGRRRA